MADREQIRRDVEQAPGVYAGYCRALLAELEQAERERDEWKRRLENVYHGKTLVSSLAEAEQREAALAEALREISETPDTFTATRRRARAALAAYEASRAS